MSKKEFWIRFPIYLLFYLILPAGYLLFRFNLFKKIIIIAVVSTIIDYVILMWIVITLSFQIFDVINSFFPIGAANFVSFDKIFIVLG